MDLQKLIRAGMAQPHTHTYEELYYNAKAALEEIADMDHAGTAPQKAEEELEVLAINEQGYHLAP